MRRASSKPPTTAAVIRDAEATGRVRRLPGRQLAVVPLAELRRLRQLARIAEDAADNAVADIALAEAREKGTIPWEKVKVDLGL